MNTYVMKTVDFGLKYHPMDIEKRRSLLPYKKRMQFVSCEKPMKMCLLQQNGTPETGYLSEIHITRE